MNEIEHLKHEEFVELKDILSHGVAELVILYLTSKYGTCDNKMIEDATRSDPKWNFSACRISNAKRELHKENLIVATNTFRNVTYSMPYNLDEDFKILFARALKIIRSRHNNKLHKEFNYHVKHKK
ncbi:Uncharacterised protein [Candidatus Anstonella stagnisolia]|nr:Uncharacterised protein [Candidatus Anstonella stagnisolia]